MIMSGRTLRLECASVNRLYSWLLPDCRDLGMQATTIRSLAQGKCLRDSSSASFLAVLAGLEKDECDVSMQVHTCLPLRLPV